MRIKLENYKAHIKRKSAHGRTCPTTRYQKSDLRDIPVAALLASGVSKQG